MRELKEALRHILGMREWICKCCERVRWWHIASMVVKRDFSSVQFSSVAQSFPTLCNPMNRSMPGLPVHHHLPGFMLCIYSDPAILGLADSASLAEKYLVQKPVIDWRWIPPDFMCWNPNLRCDGIWRESSGRWWGSKGEALLNEISALIKGPQRALSSPLCQVRTQWDNGHLQPKKGVWHHTDTPFQSCSLQSVSVQFSHSMVYNSLWLYESQHARSPCPSPTPGVHSDS